MVSEVKKVWIIKMQQWTFQAALMFYHFKFFWRGGGAEFDIWILYTLITYHEKLFNLC